MQHNRKIGKSARGLMDKGSRSTGRASIFIFISFLPYVKFYILTLKVQEVENLVQEEILMYLIDQYTVIPIQVTFTGVPFYLFYGLVKNLQVDNLSFTPTQICFKTYRIGGY